MSGEPWDLEDAQVRARHNRRSRLEKARERGTHTIIEWEAMKAVFKRCVCCGADDRNLEKDHIVALFTDEASDSIENIQPVCAPCNSGGKIMGDHRSEVVPDWRERLKAKLEAFYS